MTRQIIELHWAQQSLKPGPDCRIPEELLAGICARIGSESLAIRVGPFPFGKSLLLLDYLTTPLVPLPVP